jgi:hypothetical protein
VVGHLVREDSGRARHDDVRRDNGRHQNVVQPGRRRLDPGQALAAADFVPRDRDLRVAAKNGGVEELFGDALLAGVDDLETGRGPRDLGDMAGFHGVTKHDSLSAAGDWR